MKELRLLAFDLGASNGRALLGKYDGHRLALEEVHKFANGPESVHGKQYWDILGLFSQLKVGLVKAARLGPIDSAGLDTWGVDYGLLDSTQELLTNVVHYRDQRTDGLLDQIFAKVSREEIYKNTGIQFMQINTLVQLYADLVYRPWTLQNAASLLFVPDLLNYFLTGQMYNEYTISSTSQLFNPATQDWAGPLFAKLNLPEKIMGDLIFPGETVGSLTPEIRQETGIDWDLPIIAVGSHDTASAVAATPLTTTANSVYISSGTWSLLGMELPQPVISAQSLAENFTNECGVGKTIRFLKNISGLWLIQECRRSWKRQGLDLSYDEISRAAHKAPAFKAKINPDDPRFLNPPDMPSAIEEYCRDTKQPIPTGYGEMARCIYESLAASYAQTINRLEQITGAKIETINMVGGGIQADILCQFTANATKLPVITGPVEATAMGNILVQLMAAGEIDGLAQGRDLIRNSVQLKQYLPK